MRGRCSVPGESMTLLLFLFGDYIWLKEICKSAKCTKGGLVMVNVVSTWLGPGNQIVALTLF